MRTKATTEQNPVSRYRFEIATQAIWNSIGTQKPARCRVDPLGRRSYLTSIAYGPSIGKNIGLGYLPYEYCQEGRELIMEYLGEQFPMKVESVGYKALYDPENKLPRS